MNNKTIFAIYASQKKGKTSSVKEFYKIFKHAYRTEIASNSCNRISATSEISGIIELNSGIKIGINSAGDNLNAVKINIDVFVKAKCDIIICACRTKGESTWPILNLERKYDVHWIAKPYLYERPASFSEEDFNNECCIINKNFAKTIFQLTKIAMDR